MQNQYLHYVKVFYFHNGSLWLHHLLGTYRPWRENAPSAFHIQLPKWMADCHYVYIWWTRPSSPPNHYLTASAESVYKDLYSMHCGFTSAITNVFALQIYHSLCLSRARDLTDDSSPRQHARPQPHLSVLREECAGRWRRFNIWSNLSEWSFQVIMCSNIACAVLFHLVCPSWLTGVSPGCW